MTAKTPRDYREQTTEAKTWRRASSVLITNPAPGMGAPAISFHEEDAVLVGARTITTPASGAGPGGLRAAFDPDGSFPLLNPATGEPLGSDMGHMQLYVALHSLYMHLASARDAAAIEAAKPPPEPTEEPLPQPPTES